MKFNICASFYCFLNCARWMIAVDWSGTRESVGLERQLTTRSTRGRVLASPAYQRRRLCRGPWGRDRKLSAYPSSVDLVLIVLRFHSSNKNFSLFKSFTSFFSLSDKIRHCGCLCWISFTFLFCNSINYICINTDSIDWLLAKHIRREIVDSFESFFAFVSGAFGTIGSNFTSLLFSSADNSFRFAEILFFDRSPLLINDNRGRPFHRKFHFN